MNLAGELRLYRAVADALCDGRLVIEPDVGRLIRGEDVGLRAPDSSFGNLVAVDEKRSCATLAPAPAVVGEVENDGGLACGQGRGTSPRPRSSRRSAARESRCSHRRAGCPR